MERASGNRVAAAVLAAGLSRRMGTAKALLPIGDRPLIVHVVQSLINSQRVERVYVITGHAAARVSDELSGFDVTILHNAQYAGGEMLSSVQVAVAGARNEHNALLLSAVDQPMVSPHTIAGLIDAWHEHQPRIAQPSYRGRRGHPILLDLCGAEEILALPRDAALRDYTRAHREQTLQLDVDDSAILEDLDTPHDYVRAMQQWVAQQRSALCQPETAKSPVSSDELVRL